MDYEEAGPELNLSDYIAILKRRIWSIVIPFVGVLVVAVLAALLWPPSYSSTATILIEEQDVPQEFVVGAVTSFAEQRIEATRQRLMTYDNLWEIIERFDLYNDMRDNKTNEEIVEKLRDDIQFKLNTAEVLDRRTGRSMTATITFNLAYEAKEAPQRVGQVANRLVSLFLEENYRIRERQAAETSSFLQDELNKVEQDLYRLDTQIADFKAQNINELPDLFSVNMQTLNNTEQVIDRLNEQLRSLKEREGYLRTQMASIPQDEETVRDKRLLDELNLRLVTLKTQYTEDYPDVVKTKAEIAELERQIANRGDASDSTVRASDNPAYVTLAAQLASNQAEIDGLGRQVTELQAKRDEYRQRLKATPQVEEAFKAMLSERNNLQVKYDDLMRKLMEARVAQGMEKEQKGERFTLIDPPRQPETPSKPNRLAIVLIGMVLGMGAGVGWAALREFSDQSVRKADSLVQATSFPVLASVREIVVEADIRRRNMWRGISVAGVVCAVVAGILAFHFLIMDLDIFWAKLIRKIN